MRLTPTPLSIGQLISLAQGRLYRAFQRRSGYACQCCLERSYWRREKTIKCLRLETDGAERAQRLTKIGYAHYSGAKGEKDQLLEYLGPKEAQDNPAIRNAHDKLCVEYSTRKQHATAVF